MQYYIKKMKTSSNVDISGNNRAVQKLRKEVERAKRALSSQQQVRLEIDDLAQGFDFSETLTRARFEELNNDLFKKTLGPVSKVLEDASVNMLEIDEIVLVGGSTRIPKVQSMISEYFGGKEPSKGINPDEAVAYGAAVQGGILSGEGGVEGLVLLDVVPLSQGMEWLYFFSHIELMSHLFVLFSDPSVYLVVLFTAISAKVSRQLEVS